LSDILGAEVNKFTDLSHTKTIAAAISSNRSRFCPLNAIVAPTVLKSQARRTKDSLYFTDGTGKILYPTVEALKTLHGYSGILNLDAVSNEIAVEQIGQGVDLVLHQIIAQQLHRHIHLNCKQSNS
jgi:hypothetical protein